MIEKLDISAFGRAIKQLERSLAYCNAALANEKAIQQLEKDLSSYMPVVTEETILNPNITDVALQFRSAAIQAFEYTYDLSWKILKRYLEMTEPTLNFKTLSFFDLIRAGSEKGLLLNELIIWKHYREMRNITSHTYEEDQAEKVFAIIPQFLQEVRYLFIKLEEGIKTL